MSGALLVAVPGWVAPFIGLAFDFDDRPPGVHCWGLVRRVFKARAGIDLPGHGEIDATAMAAVARAFAHGSEHQPWAAVLVAEARALDVVTMTGFSSRRGPGPRVRAVSHVGVMVGPCLMLHVLEGAASHCVDLSHPVVRTRLRGVFRHELVKGG